MESGEEQRPAGRSGGRPAAGEDGRRGDPGTPGLQEGASRRLLALSAFSSTCRLLDLR